MPLTAGCVLSACPPPSQSWTTSALHSHRQPRRWRCACHQLPRMPVYHQPGWEVASARGQVHRLQWSHGKERPLLRSARALLKVDGADSVNAVETFKPWFHFSSSSSKNWQRSGTITSNCSFSPSYSLTKHTVRQWLSGKIATLDVRFLIFFFLQRPAVEPSLIRW